MMVEFYRTAPVDAAGQAMMSVRKAQALADELLALLEKLPADAAPKALLTTARALAWALARAVDVARDALAKRSAPTMQPAARIEPEPAKVARSNRFSHIELD